MVGMHREGTQREGSPVGDTLEVDNLEVDNLEGDNLEGDMLQAVEDIQEHHDQNHDQRDLFPARHHSCPYLFHLPCFVREE